MNTLLPPIQALLARCSEATGIDFTLISPDTIELSTDDAFKLAALVDLAQHPEPPPTQEEIMHERVYEGKVERKPVPCLRAARFIAQPSTRAEPPFRVSGLAALTTEEEASCWDFTRAAGKRAAKVTSVGVQPDFTGRAALDMEAHKLAEAGRKSWVTRRANAGKKGGRK